MNRNPFALLAAVELLTSFWLWISSPTDSVRVWYPTVWAYCGEHAIRTHPLVVDIMRGWNESHYVDQLCRYYSQPALTRARRDQREALARALQMSGDLNA